MLLKSLCYEAGKGEKSSMKEENGECGTVFIQRFARNLHKSGWRVETRRETRLTVQKESVSRDRIPRRVFMSHTACS